MGRIVPGHTPRSVEAIVEEQVQRFRVQNRAERTRDEPTPRIVTIEREFGAGGGRIAKHVAEALGFTLWDHELIEHVAERAGAEMAWVESLDEHKRDLLDDVFANTFLTASLAGAAPRTHISGTVYRTLLIRKVEELSRHGAAVIVGRGANFLVRPEDALRVRVICPVSSRIERYALRENISLTDADRIVRTRDRDRTRFVRQLCAEDVTDPLHYDLLVNTIELGEAEAGKLVVDGYCARFGRPELTRAMSL
jgi:hypothetical protein